jgi:hypothetical protein
MKKPIWFVVLVAIAVVSVWRWKGASSDAASSKSLVTDRLWIDHVPRGERDTVQVFVALSDEAIGVFQATSAWRGGFEAFRFEAHGGELRLVYPQTGDREAVRVKARRCEERAMDFCLELDGASRGVKRYYSQDGWEIDGAHDLPALAARVEALRAKLAR